MSGSEREEQEMPCWRRESSILMIAFLSILLLCFYLGLAVLVFYVLAAIYYVVIAPGDYGNHLLVLIGGLYFCWGVLTILRTRVPAQEGPIQEQGDLPELFSLIKAVCAQVDAPCARLVRFVPGTTIAVSEEERMLLVPFASRKVLNIGVAILRSLTVTEFRAILAHEFAHFSRRDPVAHRLMNRVIQAFSQYADYTHRLSSEWGKSIPGAGCGGILLLPVTLYLNLFVKLFLFVARSFARKGELAADRIAALAYGSDTLAIALSKYAIESHLFEGSLPYTAVFLAMAWGPDNLYQRYRCFRDQVNDDKIHQLWEKLEQDQPSRLGVYPSISERLEHLGSVGTATGKGSSRIDRSGDSTLCISDRDHRVIREMIENAEEIEERLSRKLLASARCIEAQLRPEPPRTCSPLVLSLRRVRWVVAPTIIIIPTAALVAVALSTGTSPDERLLRLLTSAVGFLFVMFLMMTRKKR